MEQVSPLTAPETRFKLLLVKFHLNISHYLSVGNHSCQDQQRCGWGRAEGAEAAVRAAGLGVPPGRGGGRRQRSVGKVHHQEGGQERRK